MIAVLGKPGEVLLAGLTVVFQPYFRSLMYTAKCLQEDPK
jgi:hypothetical protein